MLLSLSATADYDLPQETFLLLMVEPSLNGDCHHVMEESLRTTPTRYATLVRDGFGNVVRRFVAPSGFFTFDFQAFVEAEPNRALPPEAREHAPEEVSQEALAFTLPSRCCPSDMLQRFGWGEFGMLPPGGTRVRAIADWVRNHIEMRQVPRESRIRTIHGSFPSAEEVLLRRVGDPRDRTHLLIAFCRALGIPARFVSGYCLGLDGPDFHVWAQTYLSGTWHNIDLTTSRVRPILVPIAFGRDAVDVSPLTLWGEGRLRELSAQVRRVESIT
ncbi:MAG: transglutaminase family protein [Capsulimonadales bacterium]|nr:transglutaminase family protein [Capsulimonadales bacterium]